MPQLGKIFERIENELGLHQEINIIYCVDEYQTILLTKDGTSEIATGKGRNILSSIKDLSKKLNEISKIGKKNETST